MAEKLFGLLGEHLGHSFSVPIHQKLGNSGYRLIELPPDAVKDFIRSKSFCGINVTIPYKKMISCCNFASSAYPFIHLQRQYNRL